MKLERKLEGLSHWPLKGAIKHSNRYNGCYYFTSRAKGLSGPPGRQV